MFKSTVRPRRTVLAVTLAIAGISLGAFSSPVLAGPRQVVAVQAASGIDQFYAARAGRPLWFAPGNQAAVSSLMDLFATASLDRVDSEQLRLGELRKAVSAAQGGDRDAQLRADAMLSRAFVTYVSAMRAVDPVSTGWEINDPELMPRAPSASAILSHAAAAPSLNAYVGQMAWMHPIYAELRHALAAARQNGDGKQGQMLRANLQRARLLPGAGAGRYVIVNAASQRLEMYDNGKVVDSMRVVVGKPEMPTPLMAAMIRYTALNPYWNLPPDLVTERVAPNVLKEGQSYLVKKGYVILSDWTDKASTVNPTSVDWNQVAAGKRDLRMRQDPGEANAMGQMKFMFPNPQGVYLHDTPQKVLLTEKSRLFSAGCVRLENAPKLARWLYGHTLSAKGSAAEQRVDLDRPVPVYLGYFTAMPQGSQIVYYNDVYKRDTTSLASR